MMATIPALRPLLNGPTPIRDWSSNWVSFNRFRNALSADLSCCGLGDSGAGASEVDMAELGEKGLGIPLVPTLRVGTHFTRRSASPESGTEGASFSYAGGRRASGTCVPTETVGTRITVNRQLFRRNTCNDRGPSFHRLAAAAEG